MKLNLPIQITSVHIHKYLIELGLFRLSIKEHEDCFYMVVGDFPDYIDKSYFSDVVHNNDFSWSLRLDKSDLLKAEVTRNFFSNSSNYNLQ